MAMKTASGAFADSIVESHRVATRVEVLIDGEVAETITEAVDGTVTLDATAQSRGRMDLTIVDDGTLGLVPTVPTDLLAPYGNELRISRGITFPDDTTELIPLGVFRIEDTTTADSAGGVQIQMSGLDRSKRIIDARFESPDQIPAGQNYADLILSVVQTAWPGVPNDFTATARTTPQLIVDEGGDRWAFVTEMATSLGMALYFDGDGTLLLRPDAGGNPVVTIAEETDGVPGARLLDAQNRWTREGVYNRVIATGENTGEAAPSRGIATDENPLSPTYYYGSFGRVPRFYMSPFITTDSQAADAAAAILARELGTSQVVSFGTLVDPRLEPGDTATITRERIGISEDHVIDQLTIPLSATGTMTGRTRVKQVTG